MRRDRSRHDFTVDKDGEDHHHSSSNEMALNRMALNRYEIKYNVSLCVSVKISNMFRSASHYFSDDRHHKVNTL